MFPLWNIGGGTHHLFNQQRQKKYIPVEGTWEISLQFSRYYKLKKIKMSVKQMLKNILQKHLYFLPSGYMTK